MATSYTNPCGSGNRTALGIIPSSALTVAGSLAASFDGATATNAWFFNGGSTNILEFWFPSKKIIDEAKWYQQNTVAHGTWKWQGSNDRTTWTDIGGTFTLGGVATQTLSTLAGNTTAYVFYRLFQVSGTASSSPWIYEIEFKIDEGGTTSYLNPLGSGNRTGTITVTASGITWGPGVPSTLVDGAFALNLGWNATTVAGSWVQFDLGTPVLVQQARFWLDRVAAQGDWKLQGSPDTTTWTDLSPAITLGAAGGSSAAFLTSFGDGTNATAYRYYRLLGVSGSRSNSPWLEEVEFLVSVAVVVAAGASVTQDAIETIVTGSAGPTGGGDPITLRYTLWDVGATAPVDMTGATLFLVGVPHLSGTTPTVSDSQGNPYTPLTAWGSPGTARLKFFYCLRPSTGTAHTFAVSPATLPCIAFAFTGVRNFFAEVGTGFGSTPTPPQNAGSLTPPGPGALVITGLASTDPQGFATDDAGSRFPLTTGLGFGAGVQGSIGFYVQPTAAPINPQWTWMGARASVALATLVFVPFDTGVGVPGRVTQAPIELLTATQPIPGRVTQALLETLQPSAPPQIAGVTQALIEILTPLPRGVITQALVEILQRPPVRPVRVTQLVLDVFFPRQVGGDTTQLVVEVFLVLPVCTTGAFPVDDAPAGGSCPVGLLD